MEIIQKESITEIINEIDFVSEIEQGFIAYSNGESVVPPIGELVFDHPPGDVHIKYGYIFGDQFYVIKIASGFWENEKYGIPNGQGMMLLFNRRTGQPEALLLDDAILTDIRTAIAGQICVSKFSNEINKIGVLGTGVQARLQVQYLKSITRSREVVVWGRDARKMNDYKRDMSEQGFEVTIGISPKDVASKCNLLITATASKEYLLSKNDILKGTHINSVGSDTVGKRELGPGIIKKADLVIADSIVQCQERGEIACAIKDGDTATKNIFELGDVLSRKVQGRELGSQITVCDLTGVSVQDIKIATAVFNRYMEKKNEI